MKNLIRVSFLVLVVLTALTGCELFSGINVAWSITSVSYYPDHATVTYTVQNLGKVDLTGVNLQIGVDMVPDSFTYPMRGWTPDFDLHQNQVKFGALDVFTGTQPVMNSWATVLSIDLDKT
jgi:hypothetical protein